VTGGQQAAAGAFRPGRVLVTGASGRLGRAVVDHLHAQGVTVTALELADDPKLPVDRLVVGSATDPAAVTDALSGVDAVIHCAAIPSPTLGTPLEVFSGNTQATFVVLHTAGTAGVRRAAIASSYSITGLPFTRDGVDPHPDYLPIDEALPQRVEESYGLSKQVDEATAAMMCQRFGLTVVALRYPYLGAPEDRLADLAARYVDRPETGARELWAYLDLRDAARAAWLAVTRPLTGFHAFYLAAPQILSARPTAELVERYHPDVPLRAPLPGRQVPMDLSAARELLGFTAEHEFPVT
jgi:nucleoside-diphosphate-sugar epimerase